MSELPSDLNLFPIDGSIKNKINTKHVYIFGKSHVTQALIALRCSWVLVVAWLPVIQYICAFSYQTIIFPMIMCIDTLSHCMCLYLLCSIDAKPSLLDLLNHIVPTIAAEWKMVGYALGAEHEVLNTIERYEQRIKGCAMELLALWLHRAPGTGDQPRTWHSVLGAVKTVTGNRAVKKIERKLKTIESTLDDNCQKIVSICIYLNDILCVQICL